MKVAVTIRGELEEYIKSESEKTGLTTAMVIYMLATQGWEYKKALNSMNELSRQMQKAESKEAN